MTSDVDMDDSVYCAIDRLHDDAETRVEDLNSRVPDESMPEKQEGVLSALAHADRIRILSILREGECCVCELQAALDAPQSTVASHLRTLRDAGIVKTRKDGKWTLYRIGDTAAVQILDLAESLGGDVE